MTSLTAAFLALVFAVNLATFVLSQNEQICLPVPRDALGILQGRGPRGPSGKRGIPGPQGTQGAKGNLGPPGQCQCDLIEVVELKKRLDTLDRLHEAVREEVCLVGVKSGKVRDDEMTASSTHSNEAYAAHRGRLDGRSYWVPHSSKYHSPGEWLQVDLRTPTTVTGVVTQGGGAWWMTSFKISFGNSTNQLQVIQDVDGNDMVFLGNTDSDTHVQNIFPTPIKARYFRLIAVTFNVGIVVQEVCLAGVKSGRVRDDEMTASSMHSQPYAAHEGRLDVERYRAPPPSKYGQWLQVDLRTPTTVTGVVTQGGGDWWVTSFKILFGNSTNQMQVTQDVDGNDMIFQGNTDTDTHVQNIFLNPIKAKYFRIIAVTFHTGISLRLDYLTC
ncbi:lactadherin-like [Clavelina lepadiformis]|uniref:lactadherin-like n=1 Tax=Clavelina lepadiformis TaxID=159417 RepID=UPI00404222DA